MLTLLGGSVGPAFGLFALSFSPHRPRCARCASILTSAISSAARSTRCIDDGRRRLATAVLLRTPPARTTPAPGTETRRGFRPVLRTSRRRARSVAVARAVPPTCRPGTRLIMLPWNRRKYRCRRDPGPAAVGEPRAVRRRHRDRTTPVAGNRSPVAGRADAPLAPVAHVASVSARNASTRVSGCAANRTLRVSLRRWPARSRQPARNSAAGWVSARRHGKVPSISIEIDMLQDRSRYDIDGGTPAFSRTALRVIVRTRSAATRISRPSRIAPPSSSAGSAEATVLTAPQTPPGEREQTRNPTTIATTPVSSKPSAAASNTSCIFTRIVRTPRRERASSRLLPRGSWGGGHQSVEEVTGAVRDLRHCLVEGVLIGLRRRSVPAILRTYCSAAAHFTSSEVAGGQNCAGCGCCDT